MAVSDSYRDFVLEQLGRVMPVTGKSMFGGVGLYANSLFFALIAEDSAMGYYEVPVDVVEDPVQLAPWMRRAINVAADAKRRKRK